MSHIVPSNDVKKRHLAGGHWHAAKVLKGLRNKSEKSGKRGRTYKAYPPADGWPGGPEDKNGYRG
jgi:hypothetical protein